MKPIKSFEIFEGLLKPRDLSGRKAQYDNHYNKIVNECIPWTKETGKSFFERLSTTQSLRNIMQFSKFNIVNDKTLEIHTKHNVRIPNNKKDVIIYMFTNILQISKRSISHISYNCKILSTSTNTNNSHVTTDEYSNTDLPIYWLYDFIENTALNQYQEVYKVYKDTLNDPRDTIEEGLLKPRDIKGRQEKFEGQYKELLSKANKWTYDKAHRFLKSLEKPYQLLEYSPHFKIIESDKILQAIATHDVISGHFKFKYSNILEISENPNSTYNCKITATVIVNTSRPHTKTIIECNTTIDELYDLLENMAEEQYRENDMDNLNDPPNQGM